MRLLIVDDEPEFGAFVADIARKSGWQPETVCSVDAFLERFAQDPPQAVTLDLQIGASDGVEALRALSAQGFGGPIVLISGFDERVLASAEKIALERNLKIAGTLCKPVRAEALRALLERTKDAIEPISRARVERALEAGEITAHFQPVVEAATYRPVKVEALARWNHPARGDVPPASFVKLLEERPQSMECFTDWMIRESFRLLGNLRADRRLPALAVNVSGVSLADLKFPDRTAELVRACGAVPQEVVLEITESAATSDPRATQDILTRLRLKGFGLSIDDFGTGYSSLVALHRMPFTEIKVDRSFVAELPRSREAATIIKTVADLARNMNLVSVAEGVETAEAAVLLRELGVQLLQGFHFSRPMPAGRLEAWLKTWAGCAAPAAR